MGPLLVIRPDDMTELINPSPSEADIYKSRVNSKK